MVSMPIIHAVVDDKVYIAQGVDHLPDGVTFRSFRPEGLVYHPLCDDFGPMNLSSVVHFIEQLDAEIEAFPESRIVYCVDQGTRTFLLGCYMILKLDLSSADVSDCFARLTSTLVEPYRDATFSEPDFGLTLSDCWRGLEQGKTQGWIRQTSDGEMWGEINIDEYRHYDNPCNGDLHEVVPGKFVAFKGPKELGGRKYQDNERGCRDLSPSFYIDVFEDLDVRAVVRLNEPEYDSRSFTEHGISHHDLEFEDCTPPPPHIVTAFLSAVDGAGGSVAVHCKAGLGRTGTLIALYMMRSCGFTAREAMGWLRIMRPGCVIGQQQHFLCVVEQAACDRPISPIRVVSLPPPAGEGLSSAVLAGQVADGMDRRAAERVQAGRGSLGISIAASADIPLSPLQIVDSDVAGTKDVGCYVNKGE